MHEMDLSQLQNSMKIQRHGVDFESFNVMYMFRLKIRTLKFRI